MLTRLKAFFTAKPSLQRYIEERYPKTTRDVDQLCKKWMESQRKNTYPYF